MSPSSVPITVQTTCSMQPTKALLLDFPRFPAEIRKRFYEKMPIKTLRAFTAANWIAWDYAAFNNQQLIAIVELSTGEVTIRPLADKLITSVLKCVKTSISEMDNCVRPAKLSIRHRVDLDVERQGPGYKLDVAAFSRWPYTKLELINIGLTVHEFTQLLRPGLDTLFVSNITFTDNSEERLVQFLPGLPELKNLTWSRNFHPVDVSDIRALIAHCPKLETLELISHTPVNLREIRPHLYTLHSNGCKKIQVVCKTFWYELIDSHESTEFISENYPELQFDKNINTSIIDNPTNDTQIMLEDF